MRSSQEPHIPGGTGHELRVGGTPRKPQVPYCEERPRVAYSRRDRWVLQVGGKPKKPRVPHCEERSRAAHSRRDQSLSYSLGPGVGAFHLGNQVNGKLTIDGISSTHCTGDFAYTNLVCASNWRFMLSGRPGR